MNKTAVCRLACAASLLLTAVAVRRTTAQEPQPEPGTELFYSANGLYNRRLHVVAIKEFEKFIKEYPRHSKVEHARYGLALSYYQIRDWKNAEPLLKALLEAGKVGDALQLRLLHANTLLNLARLPEAEKEFAQLVRDKNIGGARVQALTGWCEAIFLQSKWEEAVAATDALTAAEPDNATLIRALYQGAWARYQLERYADAIPVLARLEKATVAANHALRHRAAYLLAECYRQTDQLEAAPEYYNKAIAGMDDATAADIFYRLGFVYFRAGKYGPAAEALNASIRKHRGAAHAANARLFIGRSQLEEGDFRRAAQTLAALAKEDAPEAAEASLWLARVSSRQEKYGDAVAVLDPALKRFTEDAARPLLLFDHANALVALGEFKRATPSLAELVAVKDCPQRNDVVRMYAVCLHRAGEYEPSLEQCDAFAKGFPNDPARDEVLFVRAENLYLLGRLDKAFEAYTGFIKTFAAHAKTDTAVLRTVQIRHQQENWPETLAIGEKLFKKKPQGKTFLQLPFILGDAVYRMEKWSDAVRYLEAFVNDIDALREAQQKPGAPWPPNRDTALAQIALAQRNLDNPLGASTYLAKMLKEHPESSHASVALSELGRLRYEARDYDGARKAFEAFLAGHANAPQRPSVEYYFASTALAEGKDEEAVEHFLTLVKSFPDNALAPDASLQAGMLLNRQEAYRKAQPVLQNLLQAYPDHPRLDLAHFSLGIAYTRADMKRQALPHFKTVAEHHPQSEIADRAVYEWAWCEKALKNKDGAVARYEHLLKAYPESELAVKAKTELAELTYDEKKFDEAIAQLHEALQNMREKDLREQTRYRLGTAYFNKGDYENSARQFDIFLAEFSESPMQPSAHFHAGESRMQLKEYIDAREHFAAVVKTEDPKLLKMALIRLAETQALTRQWPEAAKSYADFLASFGKSPWAPRAQYGLGWALEKQGRYEEAMAEYRKVLARKLKDELSARSQFQIGECLFSMRKHDAAIQELMRVSTNYREREWTIKAFLEIGRVLESDGQKDKAIDQFKEVIRRFPKHDAATVAKQRLDVLRRM